MTAIEELPDDIEVIAFVDADVAIREDWLTLLVNPLQEPDIGQLSVDGSISRKHGMSRLLWKPFG